MAALTCGGSGLWRCCWDQSQAEQRGGLGAGTHYEAVLAVPLPALPPPLRADVFPVEASSTVIISPDLFSEENGQIQYYGVVATTNESRKCPCVSQAAVAPWRAAGPLDVTLGLSLSPCTFPSSAEAHPGDHVQHVVRPLLRDRGLLPGSAHTQPLPSEELP